MGTMLITPVRLLFASIIVAGAVQFLKMFVPLLNGWNALFTNAVLTAVALFVCFRFELTWGMLATYLLIGLAAAGLHGSVTKVSDYPDPHNNPTPSGTPAQNYDKIV
jgi:hypothetical protein